VYPYEVCGAGTKYSDDPSGDDEARTGKSQYIQYPKTEEKLNNASTIEKFVLSWYR
jgi:hypothetical protein